MHLPVHKAKAQLSRLVDAAMQGEEVILTRAGLPCVRLVPLDLPARQPGAAKGRAALTPAFFEPLAARQLTDWDGR